MTSRPSRITEGNRREGSILHCLGTVVTSRSSRVTGVNPREGRMLHRPGTGVTPSRSPIYKPPKFPKRVTSFARPDTKRTKMAQNLLQLLENTCRYHSEKRILFYLTESLSRGAVGVSYSELLSAAYKRAIEVTPYLNLDENPVVLLHINDHIQGIIWFWAIIAAGGIPCMSTPFSHDGKQRAKHIEALLELLANPLIVTTEELVPEFDGWENLRLKTIQELLTTPTSRSKSKGTPKFCTLKIY